MEGVEANESMRSSWEDVHKMPDQADAAQEKPEEEREASEARSPMDIDAGAHGAQGDAKGFAETSEDLGWVLEDSQDPAVSEQECFEGEAEVLQEPHKDASLRFEEEETCVHASRPEPDAVAPLEEHDSASEGGDPEASSLAGSDCEYAFVLDRASSKLPDADKEGAAPFDKGRRAPQAQCSPPQSPGQGPPSHSMEPMGNPPLPAARSGSQAPALSPAPDCPIPPCADGNACSREVSKLNRDGRVAEVHTDVAAQTCQDKQAGTSEEQMDTTALIPDSGYEDKVGSTPAHAEEDAQIMAPEDRSDNSETPLDSQGEAESSSQPQFSSLIQIAAAEAARQRRCQLDAVGVIPGGRAAFGAKLPSHAAPRRQQQGGPRAVRTALPELARPAAPNWARPRPRGQPGPGSGGGSSQAAAALTQRGLQARLRGQSSPGGAPDGRRAPAASRRMDSRAPSGAMLECYDSLWHGSAGIVASQS